MHALLLAHQNYTNAVRLEIMAKFKEEKLKALRKMQLQSIAKQDVLGGLDQETQLALLKMHKERVAAQTASVVFGSGSSIAPVIQPVAEARPTPSTVARTARPSPFLSTPTVPQSIFGISGSADKGKKKMAAGASSTGSKTPKKRTLISLGRFQGLVSPHQRRHC